MMAAVRGILVKQFGGPEVLEYVANIPLCPKPTGKQVGWQCFTVYLTQVDNAKMFKWT